MAALWISNVIVTDERRYAEYVKRAGPAITAHGGTFLARGARSVQVEGSAYPRNVIVRFDSLEAAQACYDSPEYQEALSFAKGASDRRMVFVEIGDP